MSKKVTVQYRHLKLEGLGEGVDLKALLVDVLKRRTKEGTEYASKARHRIIDLDQDGSYVILNKITPPEHWVEKVFYGQLIEVDHAPQVPAIAQALEDDTPEFILKNLDLGERNRVLRGAMYFAVVGNHVGIIEGQQVKGRTLERYLTALFQLAGEFQPAEIVILNSKFSAGDGKEISNATELEIKTTPARSSIDLSGDYTVATPAGDEARKGAGVLDLLEALGWPPEAIAKLQEDVPAGGWLEGVLKIFIKDRRARKTFSRATIDEALRNVDPSELSIRGAGGLEKAGLVKLSAQCQVEVNGSLLVPEDAMLQIVETMRKWAHEGKIDCTFD
jgi:hypothetical protein